MVERGSFSQNVDSFISIDKSLHVAPNENRPFAILPSATQPKEEGNSMTKSGSKSETLKGKFKKVIQSSSFFSTKGSHPMKKS